jgi:LmbE family N-acetylglucosaminyl deacetylase
MRTPGGRWLILAAHPDDEIIGASWLLGRLATPVIVHVTDGAPRDSRLWSPRAPGRRGAYARLRREEAERALEVLGVGPGGLRALDLVDQEATAELPALCREVEALLTELRPSTVVVQPYEGGHPDHDACAFAAHAAVAHRRACSGEAPLLLEMTSYHRFAGRLRTGAFLGEPLAGAMTARLTTGEQERKRRALACFESQAEVLGPFGFDEERFRPAPHYDFTRPPHPGRLHYETLGWQRWSDTFPAAATRALDELGLSSLARPCLSPS